MNKQDVTSQTSDWEHEHFFLGREEANSEVLLMRDDNNQRETNPNR